MKKNNQAQKGFTLIELLIVVAIIGILAALAIPQFTNSTKKTRFSEVVLNTNAVKRAVETCYALSGDMTQCELTATKNTLDVVVPKNANNVSTVLVEHTAASGTGASAVEEQIKITGTGNANVDNSTLVLDGTLTEGVFEWVKNETESTCFAANLCGN